MLEAKMDAVQANISEFTPRNVRSAEERRHQVFEFQHGEHDMDERNSLSSQSTANDAEPINGAAAVDLERLLTDLRGFVQHLLQDRENLRQSIRTLEVECDRLLMKIAYLQEKCDNYAPVVAQWAKELLSPDEAEALVTKNDWVDFQQILAEVEKIN